LRIRFNKISLFRMVLNAWNYTKFLMVWHEIFPTHKHGYRKGGKNLKISAKKAIFFVSSAVKNIFHHFWPSLEKRLEKSTSSCPGKILPTPMHTSMSNYTICIKIVYYPIWQHCSTTPMPYKQATHSVTDCARGILPNITKSSQITNNIDKILQNSATFCSLYDLF